MFWCLNQLRNQSVTKPTPQPPRKLLRYVHRIAPEPTWTSRVHFATVDLDRSEELVKLRRFDLAY